MNPTLLIIAIPIFSIVYLKILAQDEMLLAKPLTWLTIKLHAKPIFKPFFGCTKCNAGMLSLFLYPIFSNWIQQTELYLLFFAVLWFFGFVNWIGFYGMMILGIVFLPLAAYEIFDMLQIISTWFEHLAVVSAVIAVTYYLDWCFDFGEKRLGKLMRGA